MQALESGATVSTTPYHPAAWCLATCDQTCQESFYFYSFIISTVFSILTFAICLYNAAQHFLNFNNPYFQSKIISNCQNTQSLCSCRPSTASPPLSPSSQLYSSPNAENVLLHHYGTRPLRDVWIICLLLLNSVLYRLRSRQCTNANT